MAGELVGLVDAILAALAGPGAPEGLTVHDNPSTPIETDELPSIALHVGDEDVDDDEHETSTLRTQQFMAECRAKGGWRAAQLISDWVETVIRADERWGRRAAGTRITSHVRAEETADAVYNRDGVAFEVRYWTT